MCKACDTYVWCFFTCFSKSGWGSLCFHVGLLNAWNGATEFTCSILFCNSEDSKNLSFDKFECMNIDIFPQKYFCGPKF